MTTRGEAVHLKVTFEKKVKETVFGSRVSPMCVGSTLTSSFRGAEAGRISCYKVEVKRRRMQYYFQKLTLGTRGVDSHRSFDHLEKIPADPRIVRSPGLLVDLERVQGF